MLTFKTPKDNVKRDKSNNRNKLILILKIFFLQNKSKTSILTSEEKHSLWCCVKTSQTSENLQEAPQRRSIKAGRQWQTTKSLLLQSTTWPPLVSSRESCVSSCEVAGSDGEDTETTSSWKTWRSLTFVSRLQEKHDRLLQVSSFHRTPK